MRGTGRGLQDKKASLNDTDSERVARGHRRFSPVTNDRGTEDSLDCLGAPPMVAVALIGEITAGIASKSTP